MAGTLSLADNAWARYATGSAMYFAQGIPQGVLGIAMPAWLASQGVGAGEIASYLAVITLPWAFKLITGPFMDRFKFPPMGHRRPWVIGAQLGLVLSFLALLLVDNPAEQIGLLTVIGMLINSFAATQDVAVDGMSIDLTPVRQQGRLNGFMSFGKAMGWASTAAVSGVLLVTAGLAMTALVASAVSTVALLLMISVVERRGERVLPWTRGHTVSVPRADRSFRSVLKEVNEALWNRASIIVMAIMFFDGLIYGYGHALMPIAAVNLFGYTTQDWSQLVAMMGLVGAVIALAIGPLIDRLGAKRMLGLGVTLLGVHALLIVETQQLWENSLYARVILSVWVMMVPVVMVASIALAMAICKSVNSATQFAIYMSVANLGISAGSLLYGLVAEQSGYVNSFAILIALVAAMLAVLYFHRHQHDHEPGLENEGRRFTLGLGGAEGGTFWPGAMRCPKCRADMDQVTHAGVVIDRCTICGGIWFDAGEIEGFTDPDIAAKIDTGEIAVGRKWNRVDDYPCPRCSGVMMKVVDDSQPHIWYEICRECSGSFLDAGELRDLSQITLSDYLKQFLMPERK